MPKTRIGERLSKVATESATSKYGSQDIDKLNEKFEDFSKQFKPLSTALKNHLANLQNVERSQAEVLQELAHWTHKTPIQIKENNAVIVQKAMLKKDTTYTEMYLRNLLEYVHDWELVVKTRVEATQKQVKESKHTLDHYEKKMQCLTKNHDFVIAKRKTPDPKDVEKLKRNEEKLALARNSYESQSTRLCNLIEAVVDGAWKDLLPFLMRMAKMERDKLDSQKMLLDASEVIANLQNLAEENKIDLTTPPPGPAELTGPRATAAATKAKVAPAPAKKRGSAPAPLKNKPEPAKAA